MPIDMKDGRSIPDREEWEQGIRDGVVRFRVLLFVGTGDWRVEEANTIADIITAGDALVKANPGTSRRPMFYAIANDETGERSVILSKKQLQYLKEQGK